MTKNTRGEMKKNRAKLTPELLKFYKSNIPILDHVNYSTLLSRLSRIQCVKSRSFMVSNSRFRDFVIDVKINWNPSLARRTKFNYWTDGG